MHKPENTALSVLRRTSGEKVTPYLPCEGKESVDARGAEAIYYARTRVIGS